MFDLILLILVHWFAFCHKSDQFFLNVKKNVKRTNGSFDKVIKPDKMNQS